MANCLDLFSPAMPAGQGRPRILEVGAGSGKNIPILSDYGVVDAIELEPLAIRQLTACACLNRLYTQAVPFSLPERYHVICSMDFLEHVDEDGAVLEWLVEHLYPGGLIFITVPAYQWLFSFHDSALGHYRRYTTGELVKLADSRLALLKKGYFNCFLFPLIALSRVASRLVPFRQGNGRKQSSTVPRGLSSILAAVLRSENHLIHRHSLFPFGLTAFALFRRCD